MYKPLKKVNYIILFFVVAIFCATALFIVNLNIHSEENKVYAATYEDFVYEEVSGGVKITGYNSTGTVDIPEEIGGKKVVEISQDAFQGNTYITVVNIPRYVVKVGSYTKVDTFVGCSSLQAINVDAENDYYMSDSGVFYSHENGVPITLNVYPPNRSGTSYTVLSGTKYIGSGAFTNADNLTRVYLASTVYHIGNFAFEGCSNLDDFTIVSSVRIVGAFAFKDCTKLNLLTISSTDFTLGQYAFQETKIYANATNGTVYSRDNWVLGYKNTTYAAHPNYPETWGLTGTLTIPANTVGIAGGAFDGSRISSVSFPNTLKYIGDNAFSFIRTFEPGSVNINISIPSSVKKIGAYAFYKSRINAVTLNGTALTHIGNRAFSDIQISSITIPSSVQEIGDEAFRDCTSLSTISFTANNIKRIGRDAFTNTAKFNAATGVRIINNWVVGNRNGATGVPSFSNVRGFADYALEGTSITGATLPSTVYYIGEGAFKDCSNLSSVSISGNVDYIPPYTFAGCTSLNSITINSGVETIGEKAFHGSIGGSPTINVPDSVQTIEDFAFQEATVGRLNFNSSSNLNHIGHYAFDGSALNTINIPANVEFIGRYAFRDTGIYISAATNSFVYIDNWAVDYKGDRSSLTSVSIAEGTKGLSSSIFANMKGLTTVNLPDNGLEYIGTHAFYNNESLQRVILPTSIKHIGDHAFYMCYNLEKVMVPSSAIATSGKGIYNNVINEGHEVVTYVMQNQVNNYKATQNWANYDNYIDALSIVNISKETGGNIISGTSGYYFPDEGMALQVSYNQGYYFTGWWSGTSVLNRSKTYTYTTQRGEQSILAKFNAIGVNNINQTFDNSTVPASFSPISGYNELITYSTGAVAPRNAGNYTATIKVRCTSLSNEVVGEKTIAINISKRTLYITPEADPITYGDDPPASYDMQAGNVAPNDSVTVNVTGSCDYQKYDNAGAYDIYVKAADQTFTHSNYIPQYQTGTLTVNKKKLTLSIAVVGDVYYGDNPPENFTFNYSGLVNGDQISDTAYTDYEYKDNAGSYNIYVTEKSHTNYYIDNIASVKGTFTVKKKPITVNIYDQSIEYGNSIPTFTYTQGDIVSGDSNLTHIVETDYVLGESDCGDYSIYPVEGQNTFTNYDVTYDNGTLTVYQKMVKLIINDENIEYGDSINGFSFSYDGVVFNQESLFDQEYQYVTTDYNQFDNIGTYPLYFDFGYENPPDYTNYFVNRIDGTLTVLPRKLKITPNDMDITYGEERPSEITFDFDRVVNNDILTATGEIVGCDQYPVVNQYDIVVTDFDEGTYQNYTWDSSGVGTLTVHKKQITIRAKDITIVYGEEMVDFEFEILGLVYGDTITVDLSASLEINYVPYETNAGTYDISVTNTIGVYDNYAPQYPDSVLTVEKADTIIVAEEYQDIAYTSSPVFPEVEINHDGAIVFNPSEGYVDIGEGYIYGVSVPETTNYNALSTVTITVNIIQRDLTITAIDTSKTYGEIDPDFEYEYQGLIDGDIIDLRLQRETPWLEDVAKYEIYTNIQTIVVIRGSNYVTDNYNIIFNSGELEILPLDIRITVDQEQSKTYGDSDPVFSFATDKALIDGDEFIGQLVRDVGEDVGTYAINLGTLEISDGNNGGNYVIEYVGASFTINTRAITITADEKTKVYGENDPTLTYQISQGSLADGDTIIVNLLREEGQTVGDYFIQLDGAITIQDGNNGNNYNWNYEENVFTITKKAITITADSKEKTYGEADPGFTYQITSGGLAYNDMFAGSLARDLGEDVGDYTINRGSVYIIDNENDYREPNYDVTYESALLTITIRSITITAEAKNKIYGEADPEYTFEITQGSLAFSDSFSGELLRVEGEDVIAGGYQINRGTLGINGVYDNANYDITYISNIFTITRRPIDVIVNSSLQKVYGFEDPQLTFSVPDGGLVFGDQLQGELTREPGEDVGSYTINQNNVDNNNNPNYDITYIGNDFEILRRPITIESDPKNKVYGENDVELSYSLVDGSLSLAFEDELSGNLIRISGEDVGFYDITQGTLTSANNPNYDITYQFKGNDFEITQRPITINADSKVKIYGDVDPEFSYTITSGSLAFTDAISISLTRASGINIGLYDIDKEYLNILDNEENIINTNYEITFVKGVLEIIQRDLYISADDKEKSYGDDDPELTYQITQGELVYGNQITGSLIREPGENADTYAILIGSVTAGENYNIIYTQGVFEIIPLPITIVADNKTKIYGNSDPEFTYTITEGEIIQGDYLEIELSRAVGEDVGQYEILVGSISNPNYVISLGSAFLTITQRSITVAVLPMEKTYGFDDPVLEYNVEIGELAFNDTLTHRLQREAGETVGLYAISLIEIANDNYDIDFTGNIFTINRRPITIVADNKERYYGDTDPELTFSFDSQSYPLAFQDELAGEMTRDTGEPVDQYIIHQGSITNENNTNYDITFVEGVFEILRRPVTLTPDTLTKYYGEEDPAFTYTMAEGDLVFGDTLFGILTRVLGKDVGYYEILNGSVTNANNPNYDITLVSVDFEIERRPITVTADYMNKIYGDADPEEFTYQLSQDALVYGDQLYGALERQGGEIVDFYTILQGAVNNENNSNYDITYVSNDFEILRRPIEISADPKQKVYGNLDPALTFQVTQGQLQFTDSVMGSLVRVEGEDVGEYDINAGTVDNTSNPNYDITYIKAIFEITRRPIKINANYHEKIYGYSDPVFSYQITEGQIVLGDILQGSLERTEGRSVGRYTINQGTVNNDYNTNYDIAFETNQFRIHPRPLILIADSLSKIYGEEDPELTYSFMQGSLAYDDTLYGSLNRQPGEIVGSYIVNVGNLIEHPDNSNYSINYQFNFFEILPKPITIAADYKSKVYGDSDPQLTYQFTEGTLVEGDNLRGSLVRNIGNDVGEYEILQGTINNLNNRNYDITYINNTFDITPRPITITIDDGLKKYYGDEDPQLTYQVTEGNLAYNDILSGEFSREEGEVVGTYEISQGTIDNQENPNYNIAFVGNILTIEQRPITLTPSDLSKIYGEEDPELTFEVVEEDGLVFGDELAGEIFREQGEIVGEYEIYQGTVTTENNDNYLISYQHKPFIIQRRPLTLTAEEKAKVYGYDDPVFTYSITEGNLIGSDMLIGQLSRIEGEDVGLYQITHGTLNNENNPNYDIILAEIYFEITQRIISITANYDSKIYGTPDPQLTYDITYGSLLQGDDLSGELEREEGEEVGRYDILQGTVENANYDIIFESDVFAIHKRPLTLYAFEQQHPHGEELELEKLYGIEGNPLPQDINVINDSIRVVTTATSESPVGTYPIIIESFELNNYSLTLIPSTLTITSGDFEVGKDKDIWFEDKRVVYDGLEHVIEAGWDDALDGVNVTYSNNIGKEPGIYYATATFNKEHYKEITLDARLIVLTHQISTTEAVPRGIVSNDEGFDPYTVPVIRESTDENIFNLANGILNVEDREEVKTILNIQLRADSEEISPNSTVEIKLLLPSEVENLDTLRLVHITSMGINNVEHTIEGDYIVFYGYDLGDYAFITSEEAPSYEMTAQIIFYSAVGGIGLVVVIIISTAFKKKRKKMKRGRYL